MKNILMDYPYLNDGVLESDKWFIRFYGEYIYNDADSEMPPKYFIRLIKLLKVVCPNISFLDYALIEDSCVEIREYESNDYYTREVDQYYACDISKLFDKLVEFGYITEDNIDDIHKRILALKS